MCRPRDYGAMAASVSKQCAAVLVAAVNSKDPDKFKQGLTNEECSCIRSISAANAAKFKCRFSKSKTTMFDLYNLCPASAGENPADVTQEPKTQQEPKHPGSGRGSGRGRGRGKGGEKNLGANEEAVGIFAVIFGRPDCSSCARAKEHAETLKAKRDDFNYNYVDIEAEDISKADLQKSVGKPVETVPQIFIDQKYIGDYDAFEEYAKEHLGLSDNEAGVEKSVGTIGDECTMGWQCGQGAMCDKKKGKCISSASTYVHDAESSVSSMEEKAVGGPEQSKGKGASKGKDASKGEGATKGKGPGKGEGAAKAKGPGKGEGAVKGAASGTPNDAKKDSSDEEAEQLEWFQQASHVASQVHDESSNSEDDEAPMCQPSDYGAMAALVPKQCAAVLVAAVNPKDPNKFKQGLTIEECSCIRSISAADAAKFKCRFSESKTTMFDLYNFCPAPSASKAGVEKSVGAIGDECTRGWQCGQGAMCDIGESNGIRLFNHIKKKGKCISSASTYVHDAENSRQSTSNSSLAYTNSSESTSTGVNVLAACGLVFVLYGAFRHYVK